MDHGGHSGMDHDSPMCNMNMVWNWDTTNLCILTSSWRITDTFSLYLSLTLIALSAVLYEYLRLYIRHLDARLARSLASPLVSTHRRRASLLPTSSPAESSEIGGRRSASMSKPRRLSSSPARSRVGGWVRPLETSRRTQMWRSTLYATSTGIGFGLMLISMTFNGWVIGAIVTGKSSTLCETK